MILQGKSHKGKNRIKELGQHWVIITDCDVVISQNGEPCFLICPIKEKDQVWPTHARWVRKQNDPDFNILEKEDGEK